MPPTHYERHVYQVEAAHMNCRAAWLMPEDGDARQLAYETCQEIGISYIDAVAEVMEDTNCGADTARYLVAESMHHLATRILRTAHPDIPQLGPKSPPTTPTPETTP